MTPVNVINVHIVVFALKRNRQPHRIIATTAPRMNTFSEPTQKFSPPLFLKSTLSQTNFEPIHHSHHPQQQQQHEFCRFVIIKNNHHQFGRF